MPPKAKFKKEEIVSAALEIVREKGPEALTARSLGDKLGSSARPIFTVFESMKELQNSVIAAVNDLYNSFVDEGMKEDIPFKGVGKAYIRFAAEYPKFFQLLFMREQESVPDINNILGLIDENSEKILSSISGTYGLDDNQSRELYAHMWIYSHGIAVLIATKVCAFTADEVSRMLTAVCGNLIAKIKREGHL